MQEKANLKLYANFDNLETLLNRQQMVIDTVKNAIERDNETNEDFQLEYIDSQVISKEQGKYKLMLIVKQLDK